MWDKGIAYYEMALKYEDAIEQFTTVIEAEPRFAEAYFRRGLAHTRLLHFEAAIKDFRKALSLQPVLVKTYLQEMNKYKKQDGNTIGLQAIFLVAAKNYEQAIPTLDQALDQKIFSEEFVRLYKGMVALETGKNIPQGCLDCEAAFNLGQTEIASAALKKYCVNKQLITFTEGVQHREFIPRNTNDSGLVGFAGYITIPGIDSLVLEQSKNGVLEKRVSMPLRYTGAKNVAKATFSLKTSIHAGLSHFQFRLFAKSKQKDSLLVNADSVVCGDVFVASGQSNMMLGTVPPSAQQDFMRTYVFDDKARYWKSSFATNSSQTSAGRVGGLMGELQHLLVEQYRVPICIINGAVGGSSIEDHLRENPAKIQPIALNELLLRRVRRSGLQASVKAVFWYQGESNTNDDYLKNFTILTKEWKKAFPNMKTVYAAQIRSANCENNREYTALRETQRRFSERIPFVQTFATNAIPHYDGCHFNDSGYYALAKQVFMLVARDFYAATDTANIISPSITKAYYSGQDSAEITLVFSPTHTIFAAPTGKQLDSTTYLLHSAFTADVWENGSLKRDKPIFSGISVRGNTVVLTTSSKHSIKSVSYGNDTFYPLSNYHIYDGPWLQNVRGVGALSFYRFPMRAP